MSHMVIRARRIPRNEILDLFKTLQRETLTRSGVATVIGISYDSARYWLERLASAGLIRKEVVMISERCRRIFYHRLVVGVYYRTQAAIMFYTEITPRSHTPDPIAEFRVVGVSERPGHFNTDEFMRACIYIGVILQPKTYWIKLGQKVTGEEIDEPIDMDELQGSVKVYGKLNYAERYAVFFRSRRGVEMWRNQTKIGWWFDPTVTLPSPRGGTDKYSRDYEYSEDYIKRVEENLVLLGRLKMRFDNERGKMESVEL